MRLPPLLALAAQGLVVSAADDVVATVSLGTEGGVIRNVWIVMNPDKLAAWNR